MNLGDVEGDNRLFVMPKNIGKWEELDVWYYVNKPVGVHTVAKFMKRINQRAKLTTDYSNHSVGRSTVVSRLDKQGFTEQEIILLTGHKNVEGK